MRAHQFIVESSTTLNQLYGGDFPHRYDLFWDYVGTSELDKPLEIKSLPSYKLDIILRSQYRVEHLDELSDMMNSDQRTVVKRYMSDPQLSNKVIVLSGDRIIDGNHRALAAALKNVNINYIDLEDLDRQEHP